MRSLSSFPKLFALLFAIAAYLPAQAMELSPNSERGRAAAAAAEATKGKNALAGRAAAEKAPAPRRILIKYRSGAAALDPDAASQAEAARRLAQRAGVALLPAPVSAENRQVVTVAKPAGEKELKEVADRIARGNPEIEYAIPERIMQVQQVNDPRYPEQWDYFTDKSGIHLPEAWETATGKGVIVAVVDTGIRPHADLAGKILPGYNFISDPARSNTGGGARGSDPTDPGDWCPTSPRPASTWHGTHVAGTIAADTNNGLGVAGVARDAKILPVRVLGQCGGTNLDIADGIEWAAGVHVDNVPDNPNPAKVINMSLGGVGPCDARYAEAIANARKQGATVVVAAGNSDMDASNFTPANCEGVISVAAVNRLGARANFGRPGAGSNFGVNVKIAAPGGETFATEKDGILSTLNTGITTPGEDSYAFYQGTSMATPHIAGVVAMLYEAKPTLTPDEALTVLQVTAQPFPASASRPCAKNTCGAGIVNAAAAVNYVSGLQSMLSARN